MSCTGEESLILHKNSGANFLLQDRQIWLHPTKIVFKTSLLARVNGVPSVFV